MKKLIAVLVIFTFTLTACGSTSQAKAITGCFEATLSADHYFLEIVSVNGKKVKARVSFQNASKDSSHGTFAATYSSKTLKGIYNFKSEGMNSRRELIFKKTARGWQEGFGDVVVNGNLESFKDSKKITWDTQYEFLPSKNCSKI
jgi:hypothetical protein